MRGGALSGSLGGCDVLEGDGALDVFAGENGGFLEGDRHADRVRLGAGAGHCGDEGAPPRTGALGHERAGDDRPCLGDMLSGDNDGKLG